MTNQEAIEILEERKIEPVYKAKRHIEYVEKLNTALDMAIEALKDRPKGEWVKRKVKEHQFIQNGYVLYYCSECGVEKKIGWANGVNFCPNCGADMRGENK